MPENFPSSMQVALLYDANLSPNKLETHPLWFVRLLGVST